MVMGLFQRWTNIIFFLFFVQMFLFCFLMEVDESVLKRKKDMYRERKERGGLRNRLDFWCRNWDNEEF